MAIVNTIYFGIGIYLMIALIIDCRQLQIWKVSAVVRTVCVAITVTLVLFANLVEDAIPTKKSDGGQWMQIKKGVQLAGLHIKMRKVLVSCDKIWAEKGQELVVTSGLDSTHSAGSLHYYGRALDLRTRYFKRSEVNDIAGLLAKELGIGYDIVVHNTHLHVEWDNEDNT